MPHLYLLLAILAEVVATTALKASDEFTRPGPTAVVVVGYALAFYLLSLVFRTLPVGLVYAIWSGAGVALITLASAVIYREIPDTPALIGMGLIVAGVVVINVFSTSQGA